MEGRIDVYDLAEESHLKGKIFLFTNRMKSQDKDRMLVRFSSVSDGKLSFDTLRIYPEIEATSYSKRGALKPLSRKDFAKKWRAYCARYVGFMNDKEWDDFITHSFFQNIFQKLI